MVHSNTTLEELRKLKLLRPPKAGRYWQGIHHADLVDDILLQAQRKHWQVCEMFYGLSKDRADFALSLEVGLPKVCPPSDTILCIGVIHSNTRHRRVRWYGGVLTLPDKIPIVLGALPRGGKHTQYFDVEGSILGALAGFASLAAHYPQRAEDLRQTLLSTKEEDALLMEAGRRGFMPWSRIGQVDSAVNGKTGQSLWDLLVNFGRVVSQNPPVQQMEQMDKFRALVTQRNLVSEAV